MVTIPKKILNELTKLYVHDMDMKYYLSKLTSIEQYVVIRYSLEGTNFRIIHDDIVELTSKYAYPSDVFPFAMKNLKRIHAGLEPVRPRYPSLLKIEIKNF